MLLSLLDIPFGHALGKFMLLFEEAPLDLAQAHAAFADLADLAVREHPGLPWPLTVQAKEDNPGITITVEGMLALKRARYADLQPTAEATVGEALAAWAGATVQAIRAERGHATASLLYMDLELPTGQRQWLTAYCPWLVTPASGAPCHANEEVASVRRAVSSLRRARVDGVRVLSGGTLEVRFATGAQLLVGSAGWQPAAEVPDVHYSLQTDDYTLLLVGTELLLQPHPGKDEIGSLVHPHKPV